MRRYSWKCFHIIPLVFDDSISVIEILGKIMKKLNEIIDVLNNMPNIEIIENMNENEDVNNDR